MNEPPLCSQARTNCCFSRAELSSPLSPWHLRHHHAIVLLIVCISLQNQCKYMCMPLKVSSIRVIKSKHHSVLQMFATHCRRQATRFRIEADYLMTNYSCRVLHSITRAYKHPPKPCSIHEFKLGMNVPPTMSAIKAKRSMP